MPVNSISASYRLYEKAWRDTSNSNQLLSEALAIVEQAYKDGNREHLLINNYIALLLDDHNYELAFKLLEENKPESSEFCKNYAIAIANHRYDLKKIRKWNGLSNNFQKQENAIVAYVDWQGF